MNYRLKEKIILNGKDISHLPPYKRPVNTVFQRYALFPHLDVYDNIAFGLKIKKVKALDKSGKEVLRKLTNQEIDDKVVKSLKMVDLEQFEDRDICNSFRWSTTTGCDCSGNCQ